MTSVERMYALYQAVRHVAASGVQGDIVECGVWRGGSSMLAALALQESGEDRGVWLYDTFEGMPRPSDRDVSLDGESAEAMWEKEREGWCHSPVEEVRANMQSTGYPSERVNLVQGMVEDTVPGTVPDRIAVLRLDTDWYESTYHELNHLFPLLSPGGVLILDDYGHWKGCRDATDRYFAETGVEMLLQRTDYTGRMGVKP